MTNWIFTNEINFFSNINKKENVILINRGLLIPVQLDLHFKIVIKRVSTETVYNENINKCSTKKTLAFVFSNFLMII